MLASLPDVFLAMPNKKQSGAKSPVTQNKPAQLRANAKNTRNQKLKSQLYDIEKDQNRIAIKPEWYSADLNKVNNDTVKDLITAMISQNTQYTLPRAITTNVYSNRFRFTKDITVTKLQSESIEETQIAIITRPDPNRVLSIGRTADADFVKAGDVYLPTADANGHTYPVSTDYSLALNFPTVGGKEVVAQLDDSLPFLVMAPNPPQFAGGFVTPCNVGSTVPSVWTLKVENNSGSTLTISATFRGFNGVLGNLTQVTSFTLANTITADSAATYDFAGNVGFAPFWAQLETCDYMCFTFKSTLGTFKCTDLEFKLTTGQFTIDSGFAWTNYSLWDMLPKSAASRAIFNGANSYSITGMNCLFQNNTPDTSKGGVVYAARLPGSSEASLPKSFTGIQDVLRSIRHNVFRESNLNKGMFWFYTPEKVTDLYFNPTNVGGESRPYAAVAMTVPSGLLADFVMTLQGIINIELISYDPVLSLSRSQACDPLLQAMCAALSALNGWSHNPDHLKTIADSIKKVMTSDQMKMVLKTMVNAGVKLAPMVISALA